MTQEIKNSEKVLNDSEKVLNDSVEAPKMSIATAAQFLNVSVQAIHKHLKINHLSCKKLGNKTYITHGIAQKIFGLKFQQKVIVGQIVKGGTGKTTAIDNIACCANTYGAKVLKIDADPQGNLTDASGVAAENLPTLIDIITENKDLVKQTDRSIKECVVKLAPGLDLIPSRIENVVLDNVIIQKRLPIQSLYSILLKPIIDDYDFIFIDCPPTMGQAVTAASLFADIILAPLNPDKFSAKGLEILKQEIETLNSNFKTNIIYKVFLNKFSSKTILSDKAVVSLIADPALQDRVLSTTVQFSQEIPNSLEEDKNVFYHLRKSIIREDFDRLTRELLKIEPTEVTKCL